MNLTVQIFFDGQWLDSAIVSLVAPERGCKGPSSVSYDLEYFAEHGAIPFSEGKPIRDLRAYSVAAPIDLEDRTADTWPAFLLDFVPQGRQAERLAKFLEMPADAPSTQIHLLRRSAGSPVGNIRIKEAHDLEVERMKKTARVGVSMEDILQRTDAFLEVADRFSMLASGSSGLQGDWPKVALTRARDGLWYPDPMVGDDDAVDHIIAKLLRSDEGVDQRILEAEAGYSKVAKEFGLNVERTSEYGNGVLVIPRFDRKVTEKGLVRYGQESLVSAIGVAEFGYIGRHERYIQKIQEVSSNPLKDTTEYILRDLLNLAMGNPDNHGRNTALRKSVDGTVRLSPLFDFTPMKLAAAGIIRSTKWDGMEKKGLETNPDWREVCETVAGDLPVEALFEALAEKEDLLRALPEMAKKHGVPDSVITHAIVRNDEMAEGVAKLRNAPAYK
jgi:serine/threonine-protein kinase HipA